MVTSFYGEFGEKKNLAQACHRRDCPACAKFTCLATGGETGYWLVVALHIYIYQCRLIFRQAYDVGNMFEPMFFNVERCFPYIFLHCSLIFRQAFPGAVTRHGIVYLFACSALVFTLHLQLDQCSPVFRRTWIAEPEPLRGRVL